MAQAGTAISRYLVTDLLAESGVRKRRYHKTCALGETALRNAQFEYIARVREAFAARDWPILSLDTTHKERLGNVDRGESYYGTTRRHVNDHDFPSAATGVVIPHGIYDVTQNHGYLTLGTAMIRLSLSATTSSGIGSASDNGAIHRPKPCGCSVMAEGQTIVVIRW